MVIGVDILNIGKSPAESVDVWCKMNFVDISEPLPYVNKLISDDLIIERASRPPDQKIVVLPGQPENVLHWVEMDIRDWRLPHTKPAERRNLILLLDVFGAYQVPQDGSLWFTSQAFIVNVKGGEPMRPEIDSRIDSNNLFLAKGRRVFRAVQHGGKRQTEKAT